MSIEISNPRIYEKNDYNLIACSYKIINPIKKSVIMKPIDTFYSNLKIYLNEHSYNYFCKKMLNSPVQQFPIHFANFQNNIICKLTKDRLYNKPGNVPFENIEVDLFSQINIDFSNTIENEQIILIIPSLPAYELVSFENRERLFLADLEQIANTTQDDPEFKNKVKNKLSKIHLITTEFFNSCNIEEYFGNVTSNNSISLSINLFIENILGKIITSEKSILSKIIHCNPEANILDISNYNYKTKITSRSNGRIHFSSNSDEEGELIIIAQHLNKINDLDITLPIIPSSQKKMLMNNLLDYIRITSNLPTEKNIIKIFLKKEVDYVIKYMLNETPVLDDDKIDNNQSKIINYLLKSYYDIFYNFLNNINKNKDKNKDNENNHKYLGAQFSAYKPALCRNSSIF